MINISVNREELSLIGTGLSKLPFEVAAPLIAKLNRQFAQANAAEAKAKADAGAEHEYTLRYDLMTSEQLPPDVNAKWLEDEKFAAYVRKRRVERQ